MNIHYFSWGGMSCVLRWVLCEVVCQLDGANTALLVLILLQSSIFICDKFLVLINI